MIDTFETARLTAERLRPSHVEELDAMHRDARVMATLSGTRTREQTERFLHESLAHWDEHGYGLWIFRDRSDGVFVGRAGIRHVDVGGNHEVELAYALRFEYWNRGLATELAQALLNTAWRDLNLDNLVCFTLTTNLRSRRVMEKVGFVYERDVVHGELPHALYRMFRPLPD
jgi:RimJ/RimL family protein N-acetyltransferase